MNNNTELKTYLRVFMFYTCTVGMKTGRRMSGMADSDSLLCGGVSASSGKLFLAYKKYVFMRNYVQESTKGTAHEESSILHG